MADCGSKPGKLGALSAIVLLVEPTSNPVFERPPIGELSIGVQFTATPSLETAHLGRFWDRVGKEFSAAEDHAPIGSPLEWGRSKEGLPLPRLWLVSPDSAHVLQLQSGLFQFNWRRTESNDAAYPSFSQHLGLFMKYWDAFVVFIRELGMEPPAIRGAEVLKISHIREVDGYGSLERIIPALAISSLARNWDFANIAMLFEMANGSAKVRAELKTGLLTDASRRKVLVLELRGEATDIDPTGGNLPVRLVEANGFVNLAFTSLTSLEIQRDAWKRTR